jgi:hypothetical protein
MPLPEVPLATGTAQVADTEVPIRALARSEVVKLRTGLAHPETEAEPFIVSCGAGYTTEEAAAWLASVGNDTGGMLILDILRISGLTDIADPRVGSTGAGPDSPPSNEP